VKDIAEHLRVRGEALRLADRDPGATPGCKDKRSALERTAKHLARIDALQYRLHAENRQSLLIVLQGMDAAGKDGVIRKVMTAFNPQGCRVVSFKAPSNEELAHDFLWRIHHVAPGRGEVVIFNRSHYEDVLVVRVHGLVPRSEWQRRYETINQFERWLTDHGTRVLKFFLHIDRDEQRERLLERLEEPEKHWKFNPGDLDERARWDDYQQAYEDALGRCSPKHAPWFVIPANRKWYRDLAVSEIVADALESMKPRAPDVRIDIKALEARLRGQK
jgi:PPK2 family polyphosphate:nucleotide phosphotransferase